MTTIRRITITCDEECNTEVVAELGDYFHIGNKKEQRELLAMLGELECAKEILLLQIRQCRADETYLRRCLKRPT